jgi:hypothetical protein
MFYLGIFCPELLEQVMKGKAHVYTAYQQCHLRQLRQYIEELVAKKEKEKAS